MTSVPPPPYFYLSNGKSNHWHSTASICWLGAISYLYAHGSKTQALYTYLCSTYVVFRITFSSVGVDHQVLVIKDRLEFGDARLSIWMEALHVNAYSQRQLLANMLLKNKGCTITSVETKSCRASFKLVQQSAFFKVNSILHGLRGRYLLPLD